MEIGAQPPTHESPVAAGFPPSFYRLTHIDGEPVPCALPVNGVEYVITTGSFRIEPAGAGASPLEMAGLLNVDGAVSWELRGYRPPAVAPDLVMNQRWHYRRAGPQTLRFPLSPGRVPPEYTAELAGDVLALSVHTAQDRTFSPARLFGRDRTWQFRAAPGEDSRPPRQPQSWSIFEVTVGGREVPWLSRLANLFLAPIVEWWARKRRGRGLDL